MDAFETKNGSVRGCRTSAEVVVLGISYAAPPCGANRFRKPLPAPARTGARDCTATPVRSPDGEDVLTVNVWTPVPEGGRPPVLVWTHGGA
ncbi:carboxylesterase family protein [Nocardiopsis deserti]|uniref:carboxylesterase family protein n=1 Tax=Nocardiopsis deserti TaxID=2605988 RepID=UPI00123A40BF|nr:carboxylesterase family protein [Nocardiopsis deserti]